MSMKKVLRWIPWLVVLVFVVWLAVIYISQHTIPVLEPAGAIGHAESDLIITSTLLMLIVVIPVFALAAFFAWKYRGSNFSARHEPNWEHNYLAECFWWGVPCVIIAVLAVLTWRSSHELDPFKPLDSDVPPIAIQVVALDWKWLFIYPEQGIATVNFVQFPEQTPLNFEITADAPMNAFWIPALGGQIYAMPAMRSKLHLIADQTGRYRGCSANISGTGFAGMSFAAVSSSKKEFQTWVKDIRASAPPLNWDSYQELVQPSQYNPVAYYVLEQTDIFDEILMQYMSNK